MNYYDILKVSKSATQKEIRDSYKALIKKYHPDLYSGSTEYAERVTKELNDAYKVLSNEEKRKEYDLSLEPQNMNYTPPPPSYNSYYHSNRKPNLEYEETPRESIEDIMKKKIYNIVDKKTSKMSKKSKVILIIGIILFSLLLLLLSFYDYINILRISKENKEMQNQLLYNAIMNNVIIEDDTPTNTTFDINQIINEEQKNGI